MLLMPKVFAVDEGSLHIVLVAITISLLRPFLFPFFLLFGIIGRMNENSGRCTYLPGVQTTRFHKIFHIWLAFDFLFLLDEWGNGA